ncbi:MAG: MazG-like family protein [Campylobacter sp.]|uniref:MazG-like family protein n=2 Tax=Campylobacter sp. TaxID=205 RepID=UPI002AA94328|nr:MazG-like family protein [Campylobacter sp.]MCI7501347.1 MazG-like family protein [Campylobacter sp.]
MKIDLTKIYAGLKEWRDERKLTAESQKDGYIINIMEEFGELSSALRDYEKIKNGEQIIKKHIAKEWNENNTKWAVLGYKKVTLADAEYQIIDALCDIAVFTINTGVNIHHTHKNNIIDTSKVGFDNTNDLFALLKACGEFACYPNGWVTFNDILDFCASSCEYFGFNFELAMSETVKELNSRTGAYDEASKKWIEDLSHEARGKWYKPNYEKARISNEKSR